MKHQLSPTHTLFRLAILTPLVVLLALCFAAAPALAQDPDFDAIDDPLNGAFELYTVDDLLISRTKPQNDNTTSSGLNYILETEDQTISSQSVIDVGNPDCYLASGRQPQLTRIGRFFNLGYDVIATLLPDSTNASGSDCTAPEGEPNMALHIQSTQFGSNTLHPFPCPLPARPLQWTTSRWMVLRISSS